MFYYLLEVQVNGNAAGTGRMVWRGNYGELVYQGEMNEGHVHGYGILAWVRNWSPQRDSNPRPDDYKSTALPAELCGLNARSTRTGNEND